MKVSIETLSTVHYKLNEYQCCILTCYKYFLTAIESNPELALPVENMYIATDFTLVDVPFPSEFPMLVDQCDHYKLWYKPDNIYENYKGWEMMMHA